LEYSHGTAAVHHATTETVISSISQPDGRKARVVRFNR